MREIERRGEGKRVMEKGRLESMRDIGRGKVSGWREA